jgi:hypothetical protein
MDALVVSIAEYVSDNEPGWVRCTLTDVSGRQWQFVEKAPVVSRVSLTRQSAYPESGEMACRVLSRSTDDAGRLTARIDTADPWGLESVEGNTVFEVFADQLRDLAHRQHPGC